jgi:hypothetical protein
MADGLNYRESYMSAVTARSSDSKMERPSPSSFNARIPAVSHGLFFSEDNTRRVSLRYARTHSNFVIVSDAGHGTYFVEGVCWKDIRSLIAFTRIGGSQEAISTYRQVPESYCWSLPRCDQGAPINATRS